MSLKIQPDISKKLQNQLENYILELANTSVPASKSKLKEAKINAVTSLLNVSRKHALGCGGMDLVKDEVLVSKKLPHIKEAETLKDIGLIMGSPEIINNGCEILPKNEWVIPEEELMLWSKTTLIAPLNDMGFKRYMKLFEELFPAEYAKIHT
jgi:hypothetical protein